MRQGNRVGHGGRLRTIAVLAAAAFLTLFILHSSSPVIAAPPWTDAADSWWQAQYQVTEAQVGTLADGYADGTFKPFTSISRAQFTKMAVVGLDIPPAQPRVASFKDVAPGTLYYPFVEGALAFGNDGLIHGYDTPAGPYFKPGSGITRAQAFTILGRYLSGAELQATGFIHGLIGNYGSLETWFKVDGSFFIGRFDDADQIASDGDQRAAAAYLVYRQVAAGTDDFHLSPNSGLVRSQAAVLVLRAMGALGDLTGIPSAPRNITVTPGSPSNNSTPRISGLTIPGCLVTIYDSMNGGAPIAHDSANSAGYFYADVVSALGQGTHVFTTTVRNDQGLTSRPSAPLTYLIDTVAPSGSLSAPDAGPLGSQTPVVTATAADSSSGVKEVEFQFSNAATPNTWHPISTAQSPAPFEASWGAKSLPDGDYLLRTIVTDNAGNSFISPAVAIQVDTAPPTAEIMLPVAGPTNLNAPTFQASVSDVGGSGVKAVEFQYAQADTPSDWVTISREVDASTAPSTYSAQWGALVLSDGDYLLRARATDNADNTFVSAVISVTVDTFAPTGAVTAPLSGPVGPRPIFTVVASDQGSGLKDVTFRYADAADNPQWVATWTAHEPSSPPSTYTADWGSSSLASGNHLFDAVITDNAGNVFVTSVVSVQAP